MLYPFYLGGHMDKLLLYGSPGCPRCAVLRKKMKMMGIEFEETHDIDKLIEMGFQQLPILSNGDSYMPFKEALDYLKGLNKE